MAQQPTKKDNTTLILFTTSLSILGLIFILASIVTTLQSLSRWKNTINSYAATAQLPIKVSTNGRFLATADNQPYFMQADTAWRIPRLSPAEVDTYLADRSAKGYNTILGPVVTADVTPDYAGRQNSNPQSPNLAYFSHIDYIVNKAAEYNMNVAIVVMWGDKSGLLGNTAIATDYGRFLGQRYKDKTNVIWIVAGEHTIGGSSSSILAIWDALAKGIEEATANTQLITIHGNWRPPGQSSSEFFHTASWLDFNAIQSSQGGGSGNWNLVTTDYQKSPAKPTFDSEPTYENNNWWKADGVRRHAYWNVFAGGFGIGYGADGVWNFDGWQNALQYEGASQMQHLRKLMLSRPYFSRIPDQTVIASTIQDGDTHPQATRDASGSYAMVYLPSNQTVTIAMTKISGPSIKAYWFNPRNGEATLISQYPAGGTRQFTPPSGGPDWVLVLEDASKNFPSPGADTTLPTLTPSATPTNTPSADINGDGYVNVFDLGMMVGFYAQPITATSTELHRKSDLNKDNTINVFDLGMLIGQYRG